MNYLSIDHMIVYASLLITFIIGLRAGKGIKTIREYAVGNKMFGTASLVFTFLATNLSGDSIINDGGIIFSDGIIMTVVLLSLIVQFPLIAFFIAPNAVYFPNCITLGDMMQQLYGKASGVLAGLLSLLQAIFFASREFVVLGIICESLIGINFKSAILIGGFMLTLYTAHGGIKSVVKTDVLQFLMIVVGIPIIAYMAVNQVGDMDTLLSRVPQEKWLIMDHPKFYFYLTLCMIIPAGIIDAAIIQRLLMGKTKKHLRNQYLVLAFVDPLFRCLISLIALAGTVLYPNGKGSEIVPHMVNDFIPIGFKGLVIAGLLAIVMSTIDSYLHVTGLILVHDVIKPLCCQGRKPLSESLEKRFSQYATIIVGIGAISFGLHTPDPLVLLMNSLEATGPLLFIPFLSGLVGLKPDPKMFYSAAVVTIAAWLNCKLLLPEDYSYLTTLICIIINGIAFFGTHFYINNGFKKADRSQDKTLNEYVASRFSLAWLTPKNILIHVNKQIMQNYYRPSCPKCTVFQNLLQSITPPYALAGIVCLLSLIVPHFLCNDMLKKYTFFFLTVNGIGIILCVLLMAKEKCSHACEKKYLPYLFHFTLLYCLPCISIFTFVMSHGHSFWLVNMLLSWAFLVTFVDWSMVILLTVVAIVVNFLLYPSFAPKYWEFNISSTLLIYQVLLALVIGLIASRRKQQYTQQVAHTCQQLVLTHALWEADYLYNLQYQALQKQQLELQKEPLATAKAGLRFLAKLMPLERSLSQRGLEQLDAFVNYYKTSFYYSMDAMQLKLSTCSLKDLLAKMNLALHDSTLTNRIVIQLPTKQQNITCDVEKIVQLLASHLKELAKQIPPEWKIQLAIHDTELCYRLQVVTQKECLRKLPALAFMLCPQGLNEAPPIQSNYMGTTTPVPLPVPKTALDLPKHNQAKVIEAHYGYHEEQKSQDGGNHEEQKIQTGQEGSMPQGGCLYTLVVLPVSVDAIRSAIVDKNPLPKELPLETPESLKIEQDFLDQLAQSFCVLDETIARDTITMIKYAHQGQRRKSGEPFYTHPLQVAMILLTITKDSDAILAALLHDVVEDTAVSLEQIAYQYGRRVAYLVQTLTHLDPTGKKTKLTEAENHAQLAAAENKEAVLIKLADRLHNMRTIAFHKPEKQRYISQETLDFYLPLGKYIKDQGVDKVLQELKNICEALVER